MNNKKNTFLTLITQEIPTVLGTVPGIESED